MQLFPAIDLRGGKVVRLTQGDYSRMTVYGEDPCAQARQFLTAGAKNLHVVDLDGAKDGTLSNYDTIAALAKQGGLYIEVGGGIRTEERIEKYLALGVGRCILGSVAVTDFAFTARMLQKYGDRIAVGRRRIRRRRVKWCRRSTISILSLRVQSLRRWCSNARSSSGICRSIIFS